MQRERRSIGRTVLGRFLRPSNTTSTGAEYDGSYCSKNKSVRLYRASLEGDVTAEFQILETSLERQQRIGQMIQRAKMKDDIELAGTAECFRTGQLKFTRDACQRSKKTRRLDMTRDNIDACDRKLVFQSGMD